MENSNENPMFDPDMGQQMILRNDAAAVARATQEIQASLVIAQRFPRDEIKAKTRILEACKRRGLAEVAEYEYVRGTSRITGPTIDLLRAIANRWGNLLFGWDEVERRDGISRVRCWAWDTQSNSRAERTMQVRHFRDTQAGGYELSDERDIYELIANQAARRVRACLEEVVDSDIVQDAIEACRETLKKGEKVPLKDRAVQMVNSFAEFGVTLAQIEKRLGHKLDAVSEIELASLRRIWKSLRDGVGRREEYFKPETAEPSFGSPEASPIPAAAKKQTASGPAPAPAAAPATAQPASSAPEEGVSVENLFAPTSPPEPPSPPSAPPPPPQETNDLKLIRKACLQKPVIKESVLLQALAELGITDGSVSTLEELQMVKPEAIRKVVEKWADLSTKIRQAMG